jgi:hypothetical protein
MSSISEIPNAKQIRYFTYLEWRRAGKPIQELARRYDLGSEVALYHVMRQDGFPVCEVCGDYTKDPAHCEEQEDGRRRKPGRGSGESVELPPAREAIPLFKEMLEVLREAIEGLEHRKEYFQDGRFVVETHLQGHAYDGGELVEFKGAFAGGGEQSPPEPLTSLIAIYILAGLPLEPLLSTLSREPADVDLDQLDLNIEGKRRKRGLTPGLKSKARNVARLIRGGILRPGAHTDEFSADQHDAAWFVYRLQQRGLTGKEIEQKLRKQGYGRQDVAWLRKLGVLPPTL